MGRANISNKQSCEWYTPSSTLCGELVLDESVQFSGQWLVAWPFAQGYNGKRLEKYKEV